jgi:hypothetical protein
MDIMETPLQPFFQAIAQAQDETELRGAIMATLSTYFAANRWGLMFLDQLPTVNENTPKMLRLALSLDHNPVLRYLIQRHTAVHEEIIFPPGVWQTICPRADHWRSLVDYRTYSKASVEADVPQT